MLVAPGLPTVLVGLEERPTRPAGRRRRAAPGAATDSTKVNGSAGPDRDRVEVGPARSSTSGSVLSAMASAPTAHEDVASVLGAVAGGRSPRRGSKSTTARPGPPSAESRRTSSVAGSSRPATSATMPSVSVSRPAPVSTSSPAWPCRRGIGGRHARRARRGRAGSARRPPPTRRPKPARRRSGGRTSSRSSRRETTSAAVRVSPISP